MHATVGVWLTVSHDDSVIVSQQVRRTMLGTAKVTAGSTPIKQDSVHGLLHIVLYQVSALAPLRAWGSM